MSPYRKEIFRSLAIIGFVIGSSGNWIGGTIGKIITIIGILMLIIGVIGIWGWGQKREEKEYKKNNSSEK